MLTTPPVKKIDLHFPLGLEVTARNLKGVTVKDALDAIYKQFKKKVRQPHGWFATVDEFTDLTVG
jgi:RecA-family ATPase